MTDIPIIFSAPMVRALLDGRKTMTRRLAHKEPIHHDGRELGAGDKVVMMPVGSTPLPMLLRASLWQKVQPSDRLWVRERTKCIAIRGDEIKVRYDADGYEPGVWLPFPPRLRFTPRVGEHLSMGCYLEASRITLDVSATKIERLQNISDQDARAEGIQLKIDKHGNRLVDIGSKHSPLHYIDPTLRGQGDKAIDAAWTFRCHFAALWDSLHGPDAWDANPEVVALSFTVHKCNIADTPTPA